MHTSTLDLVAAQPFDFGASLRFLSEFPATADEQLVTETALTKAFRVCGRTVAAELTGAGDGRVRCVLHAEEPIGDEVRSAAADRVGFFLSLDDELEEFYAVARGDPAFASVVNSLYGYHQVKFPSPWENLIWSVLAQRTPMTVATAAKRALIEEFGNTISVAATSFSAFPDPRQLESLSLERLTELVRNTRKAGLLHRLFQELPRLDERFLRTAPHDEVRQRLLDLPGIGPWSADFALIRGLGRMNEVPTEKALLRAAAKVYDQSISESDLCELAAPYGRWRGYWAHYLRLAA
ncbi:MAG: DNA-3-methyladenine glycosylase family protein [Stackebrandtia sp.]